MPSIRLTPLQPTSFDLWRDRVLTAPRRVLIQEAASERAETAGTFQTLATRLVGDDNAPTLASQIQQLTDTLKALLADQRGARPVGIGESAADLRLALSEGGPVVSALQDCATAIAELEVVDDDADDDLGIPDDAGMTILLSLDLLRQPLLDEALKIEELNSALHEWNYRDLTQKAKEVLSAMHEDWLARFSVLADALPPGPPGLMNEARRQRFSELIGLEHDIALARAETVFGGTGAGTGTGTGTGTGAGAPSPTTSPASAPVSSAKTGAAAGSKAP